MASASLAYQLCTAGNYIPSTLSKTVSGGNFVNVATPLAANPAFELAANTAPSLGSVGLGAGATFTSLGGNLASDNMAAYLNGTGDLNSTNSLLALLAHNGGPTNTHALTAASLARDSGRTTGTPINDQRGLPRPYGPPDRGTYESAT